MEIRKLKRERFDFLKYQRTEKLKTWFLVLILYKLIMRLFSMCLLVLFLHLLYKVGVGFRNYKASRPALLQCSKLYGWMNPKDQEKGTVDWYTQHSIYLRNINPAGGSRGEPSWYGACNLVQCSVLWQCTTNLNNE